MSDSDRKRVWSALSIDDPVSVATLVKRLSMTSDSVRTACNGLQRDGGAKAVGSRKPGKQLWVRVGEHYPVYGAPHKPQMGGEKFNPVAMMDLWTAWRM